MYRFIAVGILYMINVFVSCMSETGNSKSVNPESIYFDYQIWGDEESKDVTVILQYRYRDAEGITILPEHTGRVEFDGEILQADSSRMNGFYYEAMFPLKNASGKHNIVFTDLNNKQYKEEFDFPIIYLKTKLPRVISRKELVFDIAGLDSGEMVRVLLNDTSFYSRGIDKSDTIRNSRITITQMDLENLGNSPVYMEIYKEEDRPLKETTKAGGRLSISYGLKRVFELKGAPNP